MILYCVPTGLGRCCRCKLTLNSISLQILTDRYARTCTQYPIFMLYVYILFKRHSFELSAPFLWTIIIYYIKYIIYAPHALLLLCVYILIFLHAFYRHDDFLPSFSSYYFSSFHVVFLYSPRACSAKAYVYVYIYIGIHIIYYI